MNSLTPKPAGSDPEFLFHEETYERTRGRSAQFRNSSTVSWRRGPNGIYAKAQPQGKGGGSARLYKITTLFGADYIGAKRVNISTGDATGSEFKIAKCIAARMPATEIIDAIFINYTYGGSDTLNFDNIRSASAVGFANEWHVMHPRYATEDLILVMSVNGSGVVDGNGNQIRLCEISPQRFWSYQSDQSGTVPE